MELTVFCIVEPPPRVVRNGKEYTYTYSVIHKNDAIRANRVTSIRVETSLGSFHS